METHFLLFDIDGVLLNPKGYRRAARDTIQNVGERYGLRILDVSEFELATFESNGITSEWDMIPLYILAWIESCLKLLPQRITISDRDSLDLVLADLDQENVKPINIIKDYGTLLIDGKAPSDSIRDHIINGTYKNCLPLISQFAPWLIINFLKDTRNVFKSETTRVLQNLILGNMLFEKICEIPAEITTPSYLIKYDEPFINDEIKRKLIKIFDHKKVYMSAMTARPSLGHDQIMDMKFAGKFFPEAELAIEKIGLNSLPMVGYGTMKLLSEEFGYNDDYFLKPSPVHALIALALSCNIDFETIYDFLIASKETLSNDNLSGLNIKSFLPDWLLDNDIYLHIFEDTKVGIRAVRSLNEILINNGFKSHLIPYGISTDVQKIETLKKENALLFRNINKALSYCFEVNNI